VDIIQLQQGRTRASIAPEAGGRLLQLEIFDGAGWLPLLDAPRVADDAMRDPLAWSSYPMAPWPGRIDGARFTWRGRLYELESNAGPHALHGVAFDRPWTIEAVSGRAARLSLVFDDRWPFGGRAVQEFKLVDDGIEQRIEVHATGGAFPAGVGWHPRFRRSVRPGHDVGVLVDADQYYETVDMIPTGWLKPVTGPHDLRHGDELAGRRIDACYRHPRGPLRITWGDVELRMESSPNVTHAVVYTPARDACVEPQTCAPDGFNLAAQGISDTGMAVVERGRPLVASTLWRWSIGAPKPVSGRGRQLSTVR
jgi:aldose 1-epimerase